jgi:hypothetical protein
VLVVWSHELDGILPLCHDFEEKLIKLVWRSRPALQSTTLSLNLSQAGSEVNLTETGQKEKEKAVISARDKRPPKRGWNIFRAPREVEEDEEKGAAGKTNARPIRLFAPLYGGIGAALAVRECLDAILYHISF